jgi:hypothetical protein
MLKMMAKACLTRGYFDEANTDARILLMVLDLRPLSQAEVLELTP